MSKKILENISKDNMRKDKLPEFKVGDTVKVSFKVREGGKERLQAYSGIVIARKGAGAGATFTVRRISFGEGVERVFPVNSPSVAKVEVERSGRVRRAKLYFLRTRSGKEARLKSANA